MFNQVVNTLQIKKGSFKRGLYQYLKNEDVEISQANSKLKYKILDRIIAAYGNEDAEIRFQSKKYL